MITKTPMNAQDPKSGLMATYRRKPFVDSILRVLRAQQQKLWRFPFYPLLIAVAPTLMLYQFNIREVHPDQLYLPLLMALFAGSIALLTCWLAFRNWHQAALLAGVIQVLFWSFGYIKQGLDRLLAGGLQMHVSSGLENRAVAGGCLILVLGIVIWCWKWRPKLLALRLGANVFALALIAMPVVTIAPVLLYQVGDESAEDLGMSTVDAFADRTPNIYYIVPEDYGSAGVLKKYFNLDNSQFVSWLRGHGFVVPDDMHTNYPISSISLATTLNMDYAQSFTDLTGDPRPEVSRVFPRLTDNKVGRFLQSKGYHFIQISSWYEPTRTSQIADEVINYSTDTFGLSRFQRLLLRQSALEPVLDKVVPISNHQQQVVGTNYEFAHFASVFDESAPRFVFLHAIVPHDPYVFDSQCREVSKDEAAKRSNIQNYWNQLQCTNMRLEQTVNTIRQHDPDGVIMIQSDEGVQGNLAGMDDEYHFAIANSDTIQKRSSIMAAYYLPGNGRTIPYPGMTPVNSFRLLFNYYFNTSYAKLPDKTYLTPDSGHLFNFIDATNQLR